MIIYRNLSENEINRELFLSFIRHQAVTKCWRRHNGKWLIENDPFIDEWTEDEYDELILNLQETVRSGGFVYAAFYENQLKGIVSVESNLFGSSQQYLDLTNIYVSEDMRRHGIGKVLFNSAKFWAKEHSAEKLYISAHSAIESQAFYKNMGCVEAKEYSQSHVEKEPYDCQMECIL
ncbi:GNAT family N-acetyltransferase [Mediterraneibacter agrestimuris]|uniref:GNAT family N-acetyltransferase n=1 Tax=Mediterraneibacter agrestimuris TaxID=2941333 RepID=UPI0020401EF6|nr:GNAT family N-acetyltransferase [Mediterraneibacter agrestimuris]